MACVDTCCNCGQSAVTLGDTEGKRVCVRCLRCYFTGAELRRIIEKDEAEEDERARAAGHLDGEGFIKVATMVELNLTPHVAD